jgi:hypothetical protein
MLLFEKTEEEKCDIEIITKYLDENSFEIFFFFFVILSSKKFFDQLLI